MENIVTFTTEVKEEICSLDLPKDELLSLLAGFCKVNGVLNLSHEGISLACKTENSKVAKFIYSCFKSLFNINPSYTYSKKMKLDKGSVFHIHINENVTEILESLELMKDGMTSYPQSIVLEERLRYFCAGAFLASGSVNSPNSKNYHLQIVVSNEEDAKYFLKLFNRFKNNKAMDFKAIPRKNRFVLYLKKADQIATFLSIVFAHQCLFDFENVRIEKDYFNSDNRIQICYNANYQKSLLKGEEQCKEIKYLMEKGLIGLFSEKEQIVAKLRLDNPDSALTHLCELLKEENQISLSKSGINHIFNKIHLRYLEEKHDREC